MPGLFGGFGKAARRRSRRFWLSSLEISERTRRCCRPPGRERLYTYPSATGSPAVAITTGILLVAAIAAGTAIPLSTTMTSAGATRPPIWDASSGRHAFPVAYCDHAARVLTKPGIASEQIVWPQNAPDAQVTITRVTMRPGTTSNTHSHPESEQTWIIEQGSARCCWRTGRRSRSRQLMSCERLRARFTV
jgi:mannose-6-phosphate isomerase-like protein (cupin superfamily)